MICELICLRLPLAFPPSMAVQVNLLVLMAEYMNFHKESCTYFLLQKAYP